MDKGNIPDIEGDIWPIKGREWVTYSENRCLINTGNSYSVMIWPLELKNLKLKV
jgi:hypothetical protein